MKYATIKRVRVSLFVSGCTHRCPECFNEIAWDFNYGQEFNQETIDLILKALEPSHIAGLTLLGGEPMELVNQEGLLPLLQKVRKMYPDKDIWCYTGYLYEDLLPGGKVHGPYSDEILSYLDILVDGPFILAENQRIIDVKRTNQSRQIVLWDEK